MSAKYWIKLYHEILHDRKMATLEDRLWRRIIECFLFAGDTDQDGYLPSLEDMAWILRVSDEELETDLNELIRIGILEHREGVYFVRNFKVRQAKMPKAEYMRRLRVERQRDEYYDAQLLDSYHDVTVGNTDKIRGEEIRKEEKKKIPPPATPPADNPFWDTEPHKALTTYRDITGMDPTSTQIDRVTNDMVIVLDFYGKDTDTMIAEGKAVFARWCNTKGKTGKTYSRTNAGWLEWWIGELAEVPQDNRVATYEYELDDEERQRIRQEQLAAIAKRKEMK